MHPFLESDVCCVLCAVCCVLCAVCCVLCAKMVGVPFKLKVFRASFVFLHEDFKRENNDTNNTYSGLSTVYPLCPVFCLLTKTS